MGTADGGREEGGEEEGERVQVTEEASEVLAGAHVGWPAFLDAPGGAGAGVEVVHSVWARWCGGVGETSSACLLLSYVLVGAGGLEVHGVSYSDSGESEDIPLAGVD